MSSTRGNRGLLVLVLAVVLLLATGAGSALAAYPQARGAMIQPYRSGTTLSDTERELSALHDAGGKVTRLGLPWPLLERSKGVWDSAQVSKFDQFLGQAEKYGIAVVPSFNGTPCWASSAPKSVKKNCSGYGVEGTPWWAAGSYPPTNSGDYANAVSWVLKRWGSRLYGLELWNEPNNSTFLKAPDQAAAYAALVKAAYPAAKAAAPAVPIVAGAIANADGDFLARLYRAGISGKSDAISVHPYNLRYDTSYTGTGDPTQPWPDGCTTACRRDTFATGVPWIHDVMTANGEGDRPLWLTELGFASCPTTLSPYCAGDNQGPWLASSFQMAADWPYVKTAILYVMRDISSDVTQWRNTFGLLAYDFTRKPSFATVAQAWAALP